MTGVVVDDLNESVSVVLDGSGNGTAFITPGQAAPGNRAGGVGASRMSGLTWSIDAVSVKVATNTSEAQASLYISYGIRSSNVNDFQGQTATGSTGDTNTVSKTLRPGDWITVVWTGGDAGATATMRVLGSVNPPGGS